MRSAIWMLAAVGLILGSGCVSVKAPREVTIGGHVNYVDSSSVPETASHEEARAELRKAYAYIRELKDDKAEYKRERDEYKKERDRYKDRIEEYEDD